MTTRSKDPRAQCLAAFRTLRRQWAVFGGLLARSEKACEAGTITAPDARRSAGDSLAENLAHMHGCLEGIRIEVEAMHGILKAEYGAARSKKPSRTRQPARGRPIRKR
jgi:hypothetical protein